MRILRVWSWGGVLLLVGCSVSPPRPPLCDGTARKPINGREATAVPFKNSKEAMHGYGCTPSA